MKRILTSQLVMLSVVMMAGCASSSSAPRQQDETAAASACAQLLAGGPIESQQALPEHLHYNIMVELTSNAPENQDAIEERIRPFVECAVNGESYLRVTLDGGEGTPLLTPAGLDGTSRFAVDRVNPTREAKDKREKVIEVVADIRSAISSAQVAQYGSAQRLLTYASSLSTETPAGDSSVFVVWSPLLGTSSDGTDCLDVSQVEPSEANAAAIVQRCVDQGFIRSVPNSGAVIYGAGTGSHGKEQQRLAEYLKERLLAAVFEVEN